MNWKNKIVYNSRWIGQIWVIMALVSIFNMNAFIALSLRKQFYIKNMVPVILLWVMTVVIGYCLIRYAWNDVIRSVDVRKWFCEHKYLILVVVISAILRIPMLNTLPKWDAGEYYFRLGTACHNYDFTFSSFFENFRLCNHSNLGFSFFYAIVEFLFPRKQIGVLSLNLIITEGAIACIYILIKNYWLHVEEWIVALITFVVSCTPLFLGTFAYFNVDYFLLLAFVFLVYFEYRQYNILMVFAAIVLSQTKETGVVLVAVYLGSKMLVGFIQAQGHIRQRIVAVCQKPYTWAAIVSGALYIVEMKLMGSVTGWTQMEDSGSPIQWSNTGFNCFGFNRDYILFKLKQLFVLNLSWVIGIIFIVCALILLFRLKRLQKNRAHRLVYVIVVMIAFTVFSVLYITYTLPRYNIFFSVLFVLVTLCMMYVVIGRFRQGRIFGITVSMIGVLFLIQSFWNIDGISSICFDTIDIGNGHTMLFSSYQKGYYGDGLVTNYQYAWIDQAENKMLQKANFDGQSMVIEPQEERSAYIAGNVAVYNLNWNEKSKIRHIDEPGYVIQWRTLENIYTEFPYRVYKYRGIAEIAKHSIIYFLPYYELDENAELEKIKDICYIGPRKTITAYGGEIAYYELERKSNYRNLHIEDFLECNSKKEQSVDKIDNLYNAMEQEGWDIEQVEEYYKYLLYQSLEKKECECEEVVVSKYDNISMDIEVYAGDGEKSENGENLFRATYDNILVGTNSVLPEIDQVLDGAEIDKKISIDWRVPKDYNALYEYRGKILRIEIIPRKITGYIDPKTINTVDIESIYAQAFDDVWDYYIKKVLKSVTMSSYNSVTYTQEELAKQKKKIEKHYSNYFNIMHIDQQDFLNDYAHISQQDFEYAKQDMAKARCAWKYWNKKISDNEKILYSKEYEEGLNEVLLK